MSRMTQLLDKLWRDYVDLNPHALAVYELLAARGEIVLNDPIAFRTFDHPSINLSTLAQPFIQGGYTEGGIL